MVVYLSQLLPEDRPSSAVALVPEATRTRGWTKKHGKSHYGFEEPST